MSCTVVKAENLGKLYYLGQTARFNSVTDEIVKFFSKDKQKKEQKTLWALKDISFEVNKGEIIGIIGKNGAGKSTLLKVLSRITEPTEGLAKIKGRVATLLEVATGFSAELTGKDNIYLNGSILGMSKKEIDEKFNEIVEFAEMKEFIDTPVKRYSSGMIVKLGFAVAATLSPDILLVDEVLAVADMSFQKKCLGKMKEASQNNRTVFMVSHSMHAILDLCTRVIWLEGGRINKDGDPREVVSAYEKFMMNSCLRTESAVKRDLRQVNENSFYVSSAEIHNDKGENATVFSYGDKIELLVGYEGKPLGDNYSSVFHIYNELGQLAAVGASGPYHLKYFDKSVKKVKIEIGPLTLTSGTYTIDLYVIFGSIIVDIWHNALSFTISRCRPFESNWDMPAFREGVCVLGQKFTEVEQKL